MNALRLTGKIVERDTLRYTPAGVAVIEFRVSHESVQTEAGTPRQVDFEVGAIAIGDASRRILAAPMGVELGFEGFLAKRSKQGKTLVLHVTAINASES